MNRREHLKLTVAAALAASAVLPASVSNARAKPDTGTNQTMRDTQRMQAVNPAEINIPNISQAMLVKGGDLLFLSGHVPLKADGTISGSSLEEQLEQVFLNLRMTLRSADADFSNLARITIYVRNLETADLPIIRAVRDRHINIARPPASALIGVAELFAPNVRVEIDAIAAVP